MRLKWKVGLSDGTNFTEGFGIFAEIPNEDSPWLKLRTYLLKNNLKITSLCLVDGNRVFNLPSAGKNPKFSAFLNAPKPIEYNFGRPIGGYVCGGDTELYARIEAVYENYKLQLWVDENNPNNCWILVL
jgi:hypothetical protein